MSWWTEMSDPQQGSPLRAGPVPATGSALPTAVILDFDVSGFTRVTARMPSGAVYTFGATKHP